MPFRLPFGAGGYATLNVALIALWFVAAKFAPLLNFYLVVAVIAALWNLISFDRIARTRLWWFHSAPYLTLVGVLLVLELLLDSANRGPWVIGYVAPPWWYGAIHYLGFPLLACWPAATLALIVLRKRA